PAGVSDPSNRSKEPSESNECVAAPSNADLSVTKSNGVSSVVSGASTTYTIVVSNAGPQAANGALVTDPVVVGLTQTSVTCGTPIGGAQCPSSPTLAQWQAGLAIPLLPAGGSVTFTLVATVTAASGTVANTVTVAPPAGVSDPSNGNNQATDTDAVTVKSNGTISGHIWFDANSNGRRDPTEIGRRGWPVELLSNATVIGMTNTDGAGAYSFTGLSAGTYTVRFVNAGGAPLPNGPMPVNGESGTPIPGGGLPVRCQLNGIVLSTDVNGNVVDV